MDGEAMYHWYEDELRRELGDKLTLSYEPTVTPGLFLGKVSLASAPNKVLVKSDIRPQGVRLHFPKDWQDELSEWLGNPPAEQYRLMSNWVNLPSIGVADADFDPYFKDLAAKTIEILQKDS